MTSKRITVRLDKEQYHRLKHLHSLNHNITFSSIIRALLMTTNPEIHLRDRHKLRSNYIELCSVETKINAINFKIAVAINSINYIKTKLNKICKSRSEPDQNKLNEQLNTISSNLKSLIRISRKELRQL